MFELCFFSKYRGMIVTLDDEGHLNCSYLGTNPTVFSRSTVAEEREVDYVEAQAELKQLQAVIKEKQNLTGLQGKIKFMSSYI